ncbi:MAG: glycoside hydrolase family 97 catalytic domain-containing protein [Bacteroidales bacterium]|nr:glycoside hydrolase family 97 catalytic domain-containing protein [Bacteroidales bacterium]
MKKILSLILLSCALGGSAFAQDATVSSPDGRMKVDFNLRDGRPTYSITYDGQPAILESPLGFVANTGDFSQNLTLTSSKTSDKPLAISYTLDRSKQSKVQKEANQLVINLEGGLAYRGGFRRITNGAANDPGSFEANSGQAVDPSIKLTYAIEFRVENNDVAIRYNIGNQKSRANEKTFSIRIMDDKTGFRLPNGTTTFLTPQSHAMIGWKGTKPSYEEGYGYDEPMGKKSQYGHGYTFPCLFKVKSEKSIVNTPKAKASKQSIKGNEESMWVLISEIDVDSRYCGSRLGDAAMNADGSGFYKLEFPMPEENAGNGTIEPSMSLPNSTPWRTITVGNSLKPIVETTIPWDFVASRYTTSNKYQLGKGTWSWIVWQDNSINVDDQKKYIALSKAMGFKYVLIDNWWDNNIGRQKMEELIKYAHSQGVDVFLWYSSSGYWNDIEQGPINIMSSTIKRKAEMRWMKQQGVKGIKVDFFGGDKQETMRHYENILSDADDCGLMVIFHGCTIPRGWERMYPNYVGSEAVLASENIYFGQGAADKEAKDAATHPFIRNAIGSMEFGGCFMNRHIHKGNKGGNTRRTTDAHELATCILFQNPIQNFAIAPENLWGKQASDAKIEQFADMLSQQGNGSFEASSSATAPATTDYNADGAVAPALSMDFLRHVPTTWDETRFIDGYPGKYAVLARRSGSTWYICGNNATGAPLTLTLNLDMLQKGDTATLYSDDLKTREPQKSDVKYNGKSLNITMADQGGFVLVK